MPSSCCFEMSVSGFRRDKTNCDCSPLPFSLAPTMSGVHSDSVHFQDVARPPISLPGLVHEMTVLCILVFHLVRLVVKVRVGRANMNNIDEKAPLASRRPVYRGRAIDQRCSASKKTVFPSEKIVGDLCPPSVKMNSFNSRALGASNRNSVREKILPSHRSKSPTMPLVSSSGSRFYANVIQRSGSLRKEMRPVLKATSFSQPDLYNMRTPSL